jgi:hypothetical protein
MGVMAYRVVLGTCLIAVLLCGAPPARACGGGGVTTRQDGSVGADAQRIFLSVRSTGVTDIVVQIGVPETTADYGVLIPVPSEPTLSPQPVSAAEFDKLELATAPSIYVTEGDGGGGLSCGCAGADAPLGDAGGVSVGAPQNIGPVTAVVLSGESGAAVDGWLGENGFNIAEAWRPLLDEYAGAGKYFIAVKRGDSRVDGTPSSIGLRYTIAGDHRDLSLRFARLGAAETVAFTVFLSAPSAMAPSAPFQALTLEDLDRDILRRSTYSTAVRHAVSARGSQAFVLEGSWNTTDSSLDSALMALADDGDVLTRLSTVVYASTLDADVNFGTPHRSPIPNERYAALDPPPLEAATLSFAAVLLVGGAFRRSLRPKFRRRRTAAPETERQSST